VFKERERRRSTQSLTFFAAEAATTRMDGRRARFASRTVESKKTGFVDTAWAALSRGSGNSP
jgi:hypothetical protein